MKERVIRICSKGKIALNYRGTELLQKHAGESDEDAWNRMKGRIGNGTDLDQTTITVPGATPSASSIPPSPLPKIEPICGDPISEGGTVDPEGGVTPTPSQNPEQTPLSIFGTSSDQESVVLNTENSTSSLNLLGKIEGWGIGPASVIRKARVGTTKLNIAQLKKAIEGVPEGSNIDFVLEIDSMTGAQLRKFITNLPDGSTYDLSMVKEDPSK
jgi:hypothetical protein